MHSTLRQTDRQTDTDTDTHTHTHTHTRKQDHRRLHAPDLLCIFRGAGGIIDIHDAEDQHLLPFEVVLDLQLSRKLWVVGVLDPLSLSMRTCVYVCIRAKERACMHAGERLRARVCALLACICIPVVAPRTARTQTCPIRVSALVAWSTSYRKHMGSDLLVQSIEASPSAWTDNFTRATGPTIAPRQGSHNLRTL